MRKDNDDSTRLRRAVAVAAVLLGIVGAALLMARCSEPSTVAAPSGSAGAPVGAGADSTNAAAAAQARLGEWAGEHVALVAVDWLDADTAVVTAALGSGEHVAITVVRAEAGWHAPWPPTATAAVEVAGAEAFEEVPPAAAGDDRWQTAVGFLSAWLAGEDPWRWTHAGFDPDPPSVAYGRWSITGAGQPLAVPGADIAVLPIDVAASAGGAAVRTYRFWVALKANPGGQIGVTALAHRPPPQALASE